MTEQEISLEQVNEKLQRAEARLVNAQNIVGTIESPNFSMVDKTTPEPLRLDIEDDLKFLENLDRVGRVKSRLMFHSIPKVTKEVEELRLQVAHFGQTFVGVVRLHVPGTPGQRQIEFFTPEHLSEEEIGLSDELLVRFRRDRKKMNLFAQELKITDILEMGLVERRGITSEELIDIWQDHADRSHKLDRLRKAIKTLKPKYSQEGWEIVNPLGKSHLGEYYIKLSEETTEQTPEIPDESENMAPILKIDLKNREVTIQGITGEVKIEDKVDWGLFQLLYERLETGVTLYENELRELVKSEKNITVPHHQLLLLVGSVALINNTFQENFALDPENPLISLNREGRVTIYKLNVKSIEFEQSNEVADESKKDEWEFIPYEPVIEEMRSEEESKILEVIIDGLLSHNRLWFENIQAELAILKRVDKTPGNGYKPHIYYANEIKSILELALQKLTREESRPLLKQRWTEIDEKLSEKIKALMGRWGVVSTDNLLRRLRREIENSEREYYNEYKGDEYMRLKYRKD